MADPVPSCDQCIAPSCYILRAPGLPDGPKCYLHLGLVVGDITRRLHTVPPMRPRRKRIEALLSASIASLATDMLVGQTARDITDGEVMAFVDGLASRVGLGAPNHTTDRFMAAVAAYIREQALLIVGAIEGEQP